MLRATFPTLRSLPAKKNLLPPALCIGCCCRCSGPCNLARSPLCCAKLVALLKSLCRYESRLAPRTAFLRSLERHTGIAGWRLGTCTTPLQTEPPPILCNPDQVWKAALPQSQQTFTDRTEQPRSVPRLIAAQVRLRSQQPAWNNGVREAAASLSHANLCLATVTGTPLNLVQPADRAVHGFHARADPRGAHCGLAGDGIARRRQVARRGDPPLTCRKPQSSNLKAGISLHE